MKVYLFVDFMSISHLDKVIAFYISRPEKKCYFTHHLASKILEPLPVAHCFEKPFASLLGPFVFPFICPSLTWTWSRHFTDVHLSVNLSPGHGLGTLQTFICLSIPLHHFPPCFGGGAAQLRRRSISPTPQVTEKEIKT